MFRFNIYNMKRFDSASFLESAKLGKSMATLNSIESEKHIGHLQPSRFVFKQYKSRYGKSTIVKKELPIEYK